VAAIGSGAGDRSDSPVRDRGGRRAEQPSPQGGPALPWGQGSDGAGRLAGPARVGEEVTFGELLRSSRDNARLTQEALAQRTGLSVRAIRNLEGGWTLCPRHETVGLLISALGLEGAAADHLWKVARPPTVDTPPDARTDWPVLPGSRLVGPPRQLPPAARHFVGREGYLRQLEWFAGSEVTQGAARILVLSGAPGVGKTGLGVYWGHLSRHRFPDGQLYADFGGEGGGPDRVKEVLPAFLRAFGIAPGASPKRMIEESALFRTLVADLRTLILLDDVSCAEQVRPLLPATGRSVVVVTSRQQLCTLVAHDDAYPIQLGPLPHAAAAQLLQTLIGPRTMADPASTERLASRCGGVPRALRAVAEYVVSNPTKPLRSLLVDPAPGLLDSWPAQAPGPTTIARYVAGG
jgi:DNA-binding XRE family transcriptional regulator